MWAGYAPGPGATECQFIPRREVPNLFHVFLEFYLQVGTPVRPRVLYAAGPGPAVLYLSSVSLRDEFPILTAVTAFSSTLVQV